MIQYHSDSRRALRPALDKPTRSGRSLSAEVLVCLESRMADAWVRAMSGAREPVCSELVLVLASRAVPEVL